MANHVLKGRDPNSNYCACFSEYCDDQEYNETKGLLSLDDFDTFNQAATEAIVFYYFRHFKQAAFVDHDVVVADPPSKKDVDVVATGLFGYDVRVEVKTPDLPVEDGNLHIKMAYRSGNTEESRRAMLEPCEDLQKNIRENGHDVQIDKLDDLKIKTFLENANKKYGKPSQEKDINILFVGSDTNIMFDFFRFFTNRTTGTFSPDPYIKPSDYPNIDYIVFSNCSEGHIDDNFTFNPWDLKNYLCFVLPLKPSDYSEKHHFVDSIFSSKLQDLFLYVRQSKNPLPEDFQLANFISDNCPCFCLNKSLRKY